VDYPEPGEAQALVYGHLQRPFARHLLFNFGDDPAGSRELLSAIPVTVGDASRIAPEEPLTSVGITHDGLHGLAVPDDVVHMLDPRFVDRIAPKRMGDHPRSKSRIERWWERQFLTNDLHLIVHIHALTPAQLEDRTRAVLALAEDCGVRELIPRRDGTRLDSAFLNGPGILHFGYRDGITGPRIAWDGPPEVDDDEHVDARHFVLGYSTGTLVSAPEDGEAAAFARGSTYGVFRWVYQDVAKFNLFLHEQGPRLFPGLDPPDAEELLAAKLMGRWRDGTPLVLSPDRPDAAIVKDDFDYVEDADGLRCPFSAHIRVMNPRSQPIFKARGKTPKVLRRGMPYGPPLAGTVDDKADRGLIGVFLCSNITDQVIALTQWAKLNDFSPVYKGGGRVQDALVGNREPDADKSFKIPGVNGNGAVVETLPAFVHTKGTALALYPGRNTLARLTAPA
jgi:deferrochelatase/peroxidase EfeB